MGGNHICSCCNSQITGQVCSYCGLLHAVALDQSGESANVEQAKEHRKEILSKLKGFSVNAYQYGWKEKEAEFGMLGTKKIALADGGQCDGKVFWAGPEFGQNPCEAGAARTLELSYKFDGKEMRVQFDIVPKQCDVFWKLGLEINEELRLVAYLGNERHYSKSREMDLQLTTGA